MQAPNGGLRLLELTEIDRVVGDGWHGILLLHPPSRTVIEFQQHDGNQGETFDPRRTGFDHMGFKVDTRAALHEWLTRFEQLGVITLRSPSANTVRY